MNITTHDSEANRREFLKRLAAAGGLAAVAVSARLARADPDDTRAELPAPGRRGYRLTPHVAKYYGKARF